MRLADTRSCVTMPNAPARCPHSVQPLLSGASPASPPSPRHGVHGQHSRTGPSCCRRYMTLTTNRGSQQFPNGKEQSSPQRPRGQRSLGPKKPAPLGNTIKRRPHDSTDPSSHSLDGQSKGARKTRRVVSVHTPQTVLPGALALPLDARATGSSRENWASEERAGNGCNAAPAISCGSAPRRPVRFRVL